MHDIRKLVESLLKWLIPVYFLTNLAAVAVSQTVNDMIKQSGPWEILGIPVTVVDAMVTIGIVNLLPGLVASIWLLIVTKKTGFNRFIWPLFGFFKPFIAVVGFLLVLTLEHYRSDEDVTARAVISEK